MSDTLTTHLNSIEERVNSAGHFLKPRKNWMFTDIYLRDIYPAKGRSEFRKAFDVIAKRVAHKGFFLANERGKTPDTDFSSVRLYFCRPTEKAPKGCTCPEDLDGDRRLLPFAASLPKATPPPNAPRPRPRPQNDRPVMQQKAFTLSDLIDPKPVEAKVKPVEEILATKEVVAPRAIDEASSKLVAVKKKQCADFPKCLCCDAPAASKGRKNLDK